MKHIDTKKLRFAFLTALLIITAVFRFYNLNWDQGHFFHSDERNIANAVTKIRFFEDLDPGFYAYGGFLIYLYRASGEVLAFITQNPLWVDDWSHVNVLGRFHSALFATLTLLPFYFLTKKLFDEKTALIAAVIFTYAVSLIQIAHFTITENYLVLALTTLLLLCLHLYEKPTLRMYILCGLVLGTAVATKTSAAAFIIIPVTTQLLIWQKRHTPFLRGFFSFALLGVISAGLFMVLSPYSLLKWEKFFESMHYESGVVRGTLPVVYTLQFTNTVSYLYQLQQSFWQLGIVFFFSLCGMIALLWEVIRYRKHTYMLFLIFPLAYFAYVGSWHTKFIRYMMPMMPFFIIAAAYFLTQLQIAYRRLGTLIICLTLLATALWAIAFFSIYTREQTRITASKWMYRTIPTSAKLLKEHWDDGLPVPLTAELNPGIIPTEELTIYEPDNSEKIDYYATKLSEGDFLVINSRRLYGTLLYLPEKYPITQRYYQMLFSGALGYTKAAEFTSYPTLLGIEINDDASEETFQVYDHPKVIIFQNTARLTKDEIAALFL
jgi:4-amino-4-deoxy-L-arabinose transferase-like glycosyltransferase